MYMRTFPLRRLQKMYMTGTNSKRKENNFSQARTVQYAMVLIIRFFLTYSNIITAIITSIIIVVIVVTIILIILIVTIIFILASCHSSDHLGREYKLSEKIEEIKDKVRII